MCTASELVYGTPVRLTGQLFVPSTAAPDKHSFVQRLRDTMRALRKVTIQPVPPLSLLTPPNSGPFRVLERHNKFLTVDIQNVPKRISMDQLKPAYVLASYRLLIEC